MEPEGSVLSSQDIATGPFPEKDRILTPCFLHLRYNYGYDNNIINVKLYSSHTSQAACHYISPTVGNQHYNHMCHKSPKDLCPQ
jgi:hypothetical protein